MWQRGNSKEKEILKEKGAQMKMVEVMQEVKTEGDYLLIIFKKLFTAKVYEFFSLRSA